MLKNMKAKALALLTALAMTLGLGAVATAPAYAAGGGQLTVTSGSAEFNGKEVNIWKMFDAEVSDNGTAYTLTDEWKQFFLNEESAQHIEGATEADVSQKAYDKLAAMKENSTELTEVAVDALAWAKENNITATANKTAQAGTSTLAGKYVATFTNLDLGYYLVSPEGGYVSTTGNRGTDAILVPVSGADATIELKSQYPTVDKKVQNGEAAAGDKTSAEIGDTLTFTLTSQVPDVTNYDYYQFAFSDNLSNGLTLNRDSIKVWIGNELIDGNKLTAGTQYTVNGSGNQLTINLGAYTANAQIGEHTKAIYDAKGLFTGKAGQTITVQYTATLNANAVVGTDNPNSAKVEYSNDPDSFETGNSTTTVTHQYDFEFILKKVDEEQNPLPNAVFELQDANGNAIDLVQVTADNGTGAVYRKAMETDDTGSVVKPKGQVTTGTSGIIKFQGLAAGTYKLFEVDAPDGYNGLDGAVEITIADTTTDPETAITWTVSTKDGGTAADHTVTIENHKGIKLPSTGGMGTVIFTVVGVAVVAGGAIWMVQRNRRNAASNGSHMA